MESGSDVDVYGIVALGDGDSAGSGVDGIVALEDGGSARSDLDVDIAVADVAAKGDLHEELLHDLVVGEVLGDDRRAEEAEHDEHAVRDAECDELHQRVDLRRVAGGFCSVYDVSQRNLVIFN